MWWIPNNRITKNIWQDAFHSQVVLAPIENWGTEIYWTKWPTTSKKGVHSNLYVDYVTKW